MEGKMLYRKMKKNDDELSILGYGCMRLPQKKGSPGDGKIDDNDAGTSLPSPVDLDKTRAVKIWLLAKTGRPDRNYANPNTYVVGHRIIQSNDQNRRDLVTTIIKCRNMAL